MSRTTWPQCSNDGNESKNNGTTWNPKVYKIIAVYGYFKGFRSIISPTFKV